MSFFESKIYNILASDSSYFVELFFNNINSFSWLIDTGATISAIKYKHVLDFSIPIYKESVTINGIGGKVQAIGYVYLQLSIDGYTFDHKFYVFDTLPCKAHGILGQDFLGKYKSVIDFSNKTLSLWHNESEQIVLNLINSTNYLLTVSARSESIHYIDTSLTQESVIFTKEICEGIFVASALVKPKDGKIPIRILNTTSRDVSLSEINLEVQDATGYNICNFDKNVKNASRVKQLFANLNLSHLNREEKINIESLCAKYSDVFYLEGDKLSTTDIYQHSIQVKPGTQPIYSKPYRLPHSLKKEINKQIDNMLKEGIIEPCRSEWSSPILIVPKKCDSNGNKKWRLVIDYRKLNNCIENDKFPLPNISDILDSLSGCMYFSHLDLHQGYYNVNLDPDSRKYTAFSSGQYQMTRMPMGLKTSPSSFSRMMTMAMTGLNYEKCLVYQDDLVCFSRDLQGNIKNLQDIFERLRKVNLKLNPQKCDFLRKELLYLGHVVSSDGIIPDPSKINVVKNYPIPTKTEEVKRFVAFVNYYRKFIQNFAAKAYPLNNLCRKDVIFNWDQKCQKAFELLKESIISHPVLQYPDFSEQNQFILQTDASGYAIGAVLCNGDGRPVAYASRSLNRAEKNYPTIEKELLAIVWAVKHFRPYLYGRKFKIQTDHKPLIYLFGMRDPSSRLMKFRLIIEEYDFVLEYLKGKQNAAADALSRIELTSDELKEMNQTVVNVMTRGQKAREARDASISNNDWLDHPKVVEIHSKPKHLTELRFINDSELNKYRRLNEIQYENECLCYVPSVNTIFINLAFRSQFTPSDFVRKLNFLCTKVKINEVYFIKNENNNIFIEKLIKEVNKIEKWSGPRICILRDVKRISDKNEQRVIINDFHLLPTSGHAGIRRMINNIKKYYFWTGLEIDVTEFVKRCDKCQKQKHSSHHVKEPMSITSTAKSAFEKIFLDIVGPLDRDYNNYVYILTIQCELSKYIEAYPLFSKQSSEIARAFVNNFVLRYGVPKEIATDRGTEFLSSTVKEVCKLLNINQLQSTAYHHQSIGALENSHKHMGNYLRIQTENHSDAWSTWLPFWCFSYNTSVHSQTKFTPFELVFGKKCVLPSNLTSGKIDALYNFDSYPLELKYRIQTSQKEAYNNLLESKLKRKSRYDRNVNSISYKPNDLILLKNETGNKFQSIYSGPYKVIKEVPPNVEILKDNKNYLVHKNRTKKYFSNVT